MFTKIGTLIAWMLLILGGSRVALGYFFAFGTESMEANEFVARRYLAAANTGEAIHEGMIYVLVGVALGILVEISKSVRSNQKD